MRKLLIGLVFLFSFFTIVAPSFADSNFSTTFDGTYSVKDNGLTHVVFQTTLVNTSDKYYATSYTLKLGFTDIQNVYASDPDGILTPALKTTPDGQEITFTFRHKAIGLGSKLPFTFSFDTTNVAVKNGSIWEVNIPGLADMNDFSDFSVHVVVPGDFGQPVYTKPDVGTGLTFTKTQLGKSGISIAFGNKQIYHMNLSYHLKNNQVFPVTTEIALPPTTNYQNVYIDNISPKPSSVVIDKDGNWLARFHLLPSQVETVHVDGRAFLSLTPQTEELSPQQEDDYLKPTQYWQTKDPKISALAQQLKTPYAIYEYVVKTLTYDFARVNDSQQRLGALDVLNNPSSAVCLEFTDLFIALSRAAGIPAREMDGFAYTQNARERPLSLQKDVLHAWPEFYDKDKGEWIMVDPTWENTTGGVDYFHTFDFDHVAFVVKGEDPNYPIPAGGYKLQGANTTQDVFVTFAQNTEEPQPSYSLTTDFPQSFMGGFPVSGNLLVENTGSGIVPLQEIKVTSVLSSSTQVLVLPEIPPFGTVALPVSLGKTSFLTNKSVTVTIQTPNQTIIKSIKIAPFTLAVGVTTGGILLGIFSIILFIITRKPRSLPISEQE